MKTEGLQAAYAFLRELFAKEPQGFKARVRRSYGFRFLAFIYNQDPTLREEILALLERHAKEDADPFARPVAMATLWDYGVTFMEHGGGKGYWFVKSAKTLATGSERYDERLIALSSQLQERMLKSVRQAYSQEISTTNRSFLMRVLTKHPHPDSLELLNSAARSEAKKSVRYWAIAALGELPLTKESRDTLYHVMQSDALENHRETAMVTLVESGVADDLIVSQLLQARKKDYVILETMGRAYALTKHPSLSVFLGKQLQAPDAEVRMNTIGAILLTKDPAFLPYLREQLTRDADSAVKVRLKEAAQALDPTRKQ